MRTVLAILTVMVVLLGLAWGLQRRLIYLPYPGPVPAADTTLADAEEVTLRTEDGLELAAWHVAAPREASTVMVANGNAGHRALRAPLAQALVDEGLGVLLFDYRGFGGNPGSPTEAGLTRDARAARRFLVEQADVDPRRLVYYGESLGAAVATRLAVEHPPAGLVLRSPFPALASVGQRHYPFLPVRLLLRDRFPLVEHLGDVDVPTAVVLGTADSIVPPDQSRAVAAAAPNLAALVEVDGADHNDRALLDGAELVEAIVALAER